MRKHTRRNTYVQEIQSAAAVRKAQAQPRQRVAKVRTAEHQALLDLSAQMRRMRLHGEVVPESMNIEYSRLLQVHWAQMAA